MRKKRITAIFILCAAVAIGPIVFGPEPTITTTIERTSPQKGGQACFQLVGQDTWSCT